MSRVGFLHGGGDGEIGWGKGKSVWGGEGGVYGEDIKDKDKDN